MGTSLFQHHTSSIFFFTSHVTTFSLHIITGKSVVSSWNANRLWGRISPLSGYTKECDIALAGANMSLLSNGHVTLRKLSVDALTCAVCLWSICPTCVRPIWRQSVATVTIPWRLRCSRRTKCRQSWDLLTTFSPESIFSVAFSKQFWFWTLCYKNSVIKKEVNDTFSRQKAKQ